MKARSLAELGISLWLVLKRTCSREVSIWLRRLGTDKTFCALLEKLCQGVRVPRVRRELFPLPSLWAEELEDFLEKMSCEFEDGETSSVRMSLCCWCELSVLFLNYLEGKKLGLQVGKATGGQSEMLRAIERTCKQVLDDDVNIVWEEKEVELDLSKKTLSYEGEEIAKAEPLCIERVEPALPPDGHGGAINLCDWVTGRTLWYLNNPEACIEDDVGQPLPKLQAKVHVSSSERLPLAQLLVKRNICNWTRDSEVLRFRGEKVLNGMFGVEKSTVTVSGQSTLRCIMNLIPSNSILRTLEARVHKLPTVSQWMSICVGENEEVRLFQSDMTSAFYLFALPQQWRRLLCFNLKFAAREVGMTENYPGEEVYLSCNVLPMGWASAVGIMQMVAEECLSRGGMDIARQIKRNSPLPKFLTECQAEAEKQKRSWWHVYLDNYAGGEKVMCSEAEAAKEDQSQVERLWAEAGIVSSKKKAVSDASAAVELGAFIGGKHQWLGGSPERVLKTIKASLWLVEGKRLTRKRLQIILGRWMFILQFRRPMMSHFEDAWKVIADRRVSRETWSKMKLELVLMACGSLMSHTWLGAKVDDCISCSDASQRAGAVAVSQELSAEGRAFLQHLEEPFRPVKVPVVLLSLFNGVGGSCRSYDVAGIEVQNIITVDIHKPANRVTSRRWGGAMMEENIVNLTKRRLEELLLRCEPFEEIHVWAGFPCVDLSSAKANRRNLEGQSSSLIFEVVRILKELKELYPMLVVHFVVENVASMDTSAREAITELLGVKPYRVDPIRQVPMSRPRFCWTSLEVFEVVGITIEDRGAYLDLFVEGTWPDSSQWLTAGSWEMWPGTIYPTCMKAIRRDKPPPRPAGIERTDWQAQARWEDHQFLYPPYQYKACYLLWDSLLECTRLLNSSEREILMGYGFDHTQVAWSASKAKQDPTGFEDERCSLIGDSFSIYSFMIFAAFAGYRWTGSIEVEQMNQRAGLPPGLSLHVQFRCPLQTAASLGLEEKRPRGVHEMNRSLLQRTNHTGSDVRVLTGDLMCPKKYPRQSVQSQWWKWRPIFATRWKFEEHINALEIRAVYLALLWRGREKLLCSRRAFHITDSYVAMSIISKGRSSSRKLQPLIRKICALLLAGQTQLILAHIDSSDNPTDEASRIT